jgi:small subunit ribosomal protein S5
VKATFAALQDMTSPRVVAAKRGKKVADIIGRREEAGKDAKEA